MYQLLSTMLSYVFFLFVSGGSSAFCDAKQRYKQMHFNYKLKYYILPLSQGNRLGCYVDKFPWRTYCVFFCYDLIWSEGV